MCVYVYGKREEERGGEVGGIDIYIEREITKTMTVHPLSITFLAGIHIALFVTNFSVFIFLSQSFNVNNIVFMACKCPFLNIDIIKQIFIQSDFLYKTSRGQPTDCYASWGAIHLIK